MAVTNKNRGAAIPAAAISTALSNLHQSIDTFAQRLTTRLVPLRSALHPAPQPSNATPSPALQALTAAALALPGLMLSPAATAADNEARFGYGFYEEGERTLLNNDGKSMTYDQLNLKPIRVDNVTAGSNIRLLDRIKFAFNYTEDTWSGATPMSTAPLGAINVRPKSDDGSLKSGASRYISSANLLFDRDFNLYRVNSNGQAIKDKRATHMMAMASPEVRKQGDFRLGYEWDEAALDIGGGISQERDYLSHFVNSNLRWDLNRKLTTLNFGMSYTGSSIAADLTRGGAQGYVNVVPYDDKGDINNFTDESQNDFILHGERRDWTARVGLTQVISKNSLLETGLGYTRSAGFLENPYKVVTFIYADPSVIDPATGLGQPSVQGQLEQRPDVRNQWIWNSRYVHYFGALNGASLNFGYRFFHDDWGIDAHTFDIAWGQPLVQGWTVTPRFRYYSQSAADFYQPYFLFKQGMPLDDRGRQDVSQLPIKYWSSDHRLSGFGALSGGITISKQFSKALSIDVGAEYYTHQGDLKLGRGEEKSYADFDNILINAALKVDLEAAFAPGSGGPADMDAHAHHGGHGVHPAHGGHGHAPAGVMFDHMINEAGGFMVGYRYMHNLQAGSMLRGTETKPDKVIVGRGCRNQPCTIRPYEMSMDMHMLDMMYAPTDWLTLMLMPQFMDMTMHLRPLEGAPEVTSGSHNHSGNNDIQHSTGGLGDTGMYALFRLLEIPGHHIHAALGVSAPTGDVGIKIGGQFEGQVPTYIHYGMQLGSGTWDFKPSLTYTGQMDRWSWGAQFNATKRLEKRNDVGFAYGDILQGTAWGSYNIFDWLSASVRGVYTTQGAVKGVYNGPHDQGGPMDERTNYGGSYWDIGFGLNAMVTEGQFRGNRFGFEWLQPIQDDVRGYQLERDGALSATWSLAF